MLIKNNFKSKIIIAPGLLGPFGKNTDIQQLELNVPALVRFFHQSKKQKHEQAIFSIEQISRALQGQQGALANLAAKDEAVFLPGYQFYFVEPVQLLVELTGIRLGKVIDIGKTEKQNIVDLLNQWYQDKQWRFVLSAKANIFLQVPESIPIQTTPFHYAAGKNIRHFLPCSDYEDWPSVLNEIQMIFFQQAGLPKALNSIWIWGEQHTETLALEMEQDTEIEIITFFEQALNQQDSDLWLKNLKKLDMQLSLQMKTYQKIILIGDYHRFYIWKKSWPFYRVFFNRSNAFKQQLITT